MPRFCRQSRLSVHRPSAAAAHRRGGGVPASRRSRLQFPYDVPAARVQARDRAQQAHGARHQHAAGRARGRVRPWRRAGPREGLGGVCSRARSTTSPRSAARAIHCLAGKVAARAAPGGRDGLRRQSEARRRSGRREEHHAADRADQSARPAELFSQSRRARRRHHRQGRQRRTSACSSISITCRSSAAISSTRFEKYLPLIGHLQCVAVPVRHEPDERRDQLSLRLRRGRPARLYGLDRRRIPAARARTEAGLGWGANYGLNGVRVNHQSLLKTPRFSALRAADAAC